MYLISSFHYLFTVFLAIMRVYYDWQYGLMLSRCERIRCNYKPNHYTSTLKSATRSRECIHLTPQMLHMVILVPSPGITNSTNWVVSCQKTPKLVADAVRNDLR
ncbi:hypothetical protein BD410DRAFT_435583 [Rickenella mellea]|uniref:Uncharacterized protein n=1 Tax=Rickenella mellea TaxID=50990 RepID=A0A4Y7PE77_9AGAM|nr:hypothetical protein BD410DRAFT_435583 [Rickenella mellea]